MQSCSYFLQVEFISAGPVQKICTFIFSSIHAQEWSFLQPLLGTQDGHDVASYLSWLPLAFITTDAWGMTHGMLVSVQHGLNVGMCGLSQNKLLMRVIKRLHIAWRPSFAFYIARIISFVCQNCLSILPVPDLDAIQRYFVLRQPACQRLLGILICFE